MLSVVMFNQYNRTFDVSVTRWLKQIAQYSKKVAQIVSDPKNAEISTSKLIMKVQTIFET
jgi:hypothetical protein